MLPTKVGCHVVWSDFRCLETCESLKGSEIKVGIPLFNIFVLLWKIGFVIHGNIVYQTITWLHVGRFNLHGGMP